MGVLADVKILLGITDSDLDDKLTIIIENAERRVVSYLNPGVDEVPEALQYIVCELAVSRFNRIGNEGMSQYGQDGESITYGDDIGPYLDAIEAWNAANNGKGVLRFL